MTFNDVIKELLNDVAPLKREQTQERYYFYLGIIKESLGEKKIEDFTRKDFMLWIRYIRKRNPQRNYFDDYSKFMNIIFNFSYQQKYITHLIKFPLVDGEREKSGRVYSKNEIERLFSNMNKTTQLQFILSYECFMRLREVLHLTWDRVDLEKGQITLRKQDVKTGTRTGKGRIVPLSDDALNMLNDRVEGVKNNFVFPSRDGKNYCDNNRKAWERAKKVSGIVGSARWHDIRHTALTVAILEKKLPIAHVSKVAGVSMRTLEKVYLHHDVEHLREITKSMKLNKVA